MLSTVNKRSLARDEGDGSPVRWFCQAELVDTPSVEEFLAQRSRLFGLAYRMLGEAGEAEDVVQDAYLRWAGAARAEIVYAPACGTPRCTIPGRTWCG